MEGYFKTTRWPFAHTILIAIVAQSYYQSKRKKSMKNLKLKFTLANLILTISFTTQTIEWGLGSVPAAAAIC